MTILTRSFVLASMAMPVLLGVPSAPAQNWIAVSLHPPGATSSTVNGLDANRQAGSAVFNGRTEAIVWSGSATSYINLHPNNLVDRSWASGFVNGDPVGTIDRPTSGTLPRRAVRWAANGPGISYIDLMPENCQQSTIWGAGGGQMCGWAQYQSGPAPGGYWSTDYASFVPLNALGAMRSYAAGCGGGQQVGWAVFSNQSRASMWSGSSATYVNLQPTIASNLTSAAWGTDGVQQVGNINDSFYNRSWACLWASSAASVVYLNPMGVTHAIARGVCGGKQVGSYTTETGTSHACVWNGTAASMVDLHSALSTDYTSSSVYVIDCSSGRTRVGGTAYNATLGRDEAVLWTDMTCPAFDQQPANAQACPGASAGLSAIASGFGTVTYQWQYQDAGGAWINVIDGPAAFGAVSGATFSELSFDNVTGSMVTSFRSIASNGCGTDAISNTVTLTGMTPAQCCTRPSFVVDPANVERCANGGTAIFVVSATGPGPITYRWEWEQDPGQWENLSNDTIATIGTISGASTGTMRIINAQVTAPNHFRCRATNSCGSTWSGDAWLSMGAAPIVDFDPVPQVVCGGSDSWFEVLASGIEPTAYQWRKNGIGLIDGESISGATTNLLSLLRVAPSDEGLYDCVISNACGSVTSNAASLAIDTTMCCIADTDDGSGIGTPDGGVTIDDLLFYLSIFEAGDIRSDVDDGTSTGMPDGGVTIDDLLYFLARFELGC